MNKILVIGCPGSGKSIFSKRLSSILKYPILHLDRIFHIDNYNQISKEKLRKRIVDFCKENRNFIIDGNYTGTLDYRLKYADTVILFDIDNEICVSNAIKRVKDNQPRDDIAPGFDNSIMDPGFIDYIKSFNQKLRPRIDRILAENNIKPIIFYNYKDVEKFFENL